MKHIYLDHSATTPVDAKVLKEMMPYFQKKFGNPSSVHWYGREAMKAVDSARVKCAEFLNCQPSEVIFTSGATEADNMAIKGVVKALLKKETPPSYVPLSGTSEGKLTPLPAPDSNSTNFERSNLQKGNMHIITSVIEHDAVLEPCMELEQQGAEISYIPVDKSGVVNIEKIKEAIKDNTVLVSIMYINSETGAIQPIRKIGKMIYKINEKKLNDWKKANTRTRGEKPKPIYFHTDATQALNFLNSDVKWNYIDLLSASAHKIYGPKGVGFLYKKAEVPIEPLQRGGHHENNIRSGTLNVPGIVGLGAAVSQLDRTAGKLEILPPDKWKGHSKKIMILRDMLVAGIQKNIPEARLNTDRSVSTPAHANFSFPGAEGESILIALDMKGICVSTGSACASASLKASHVLLAMGIPRETAHCSIRFSLGKNNTKEDIEKVIKELPPIVKRLREMNPLYNKKY